MVVLLLRLVSIFRLEIGFRGANPPRSLQIELAADQAARTLAAVLAEKGEALNMRCGGRGLCAGCQVELLEGTLRHVSSGQLFSASGGQRIAACQYTIGSGLGARIEVPVTSQTGHVVQIADEFKIRIPIAQAPLFDSPSIAVAVDIGTTTVAVLLAEVETGRILARATGLNRQVSLGDNVITRINQCMADKGSVRLLQQLILAETIAPLIRQVCASAGMRAAEISGVVLSGNTTMLHLVAGVDPSSMGVSPFTPAFLESRCLDAAGLKLGSLLSPATPIHLLPGLSAYVGADINSGVVATGMHYEEGPNLLVDIGTNGEIVLKANGRLFGCATAAGPAFEGAGLTCGTQAIDGTISAIHFHGSPLALQLGRIHDRDDLPCPGLCGSAYIDFMGEGVRHGLLTTSGRFTKEFESSHPGWIQTLEGEKVFVLLPKGAEQNFVVGISERDISRILQAKAAIAAGIGTLLAQAGLKAVDIRKLYLAGGFGLHLNVAHAIASGLLPGFVAEQIEVVGNTSLAGAYLALQDRGVLEELRQNQGRMEVVELNLDPSFEDRYIENLLLEVD